MPKKLPDGQINKIYSVTMLTVAQLSEINLWTGMNYSEAVRVAVDDLHTKLAAIAEDEPIKLNA